MIDTMRISTALVVLAAAIFTEAFVVPSRNYHHSAATQLKFGIPDMLLPKDDNGSVDDKSSSSSKNNKKNNKKNATPEKKIGLAGVVQLITAGAGAPFLGEFQGVDEESGKYMFSLEANNLVDENGNSKQTQMPYFESGWVDPEDEARAKEGFKFPWQK